MTVRALAVLALLLLWAEPALAHRLKAFATAEGATVTGQVYFAGGARARAVAVTAAGPDGRVVFRGVTDAQGRFSFQATHRMDHRITAEGADGHRAEHLLPAHELPEALPAIDAAPAPPPKPSAPARAPAQPDLSELEAMIDRSVARRMQPLREQLDALQAEIRWSDVLGGVGYIVGLGGLAYGIAMRRNGGA